MLRFSVVRLASAGAMLSCVAVLDLACGGSDYIDDPVGTPPLPPADAAVDAAPFDATVPTDARDSGADSALEAASDAGDAGQEAGDADADADAADAELDAEPDAAIDADAAPEAGLPVLLQSAAKFAVLGGTAVTITGLTTAIIGDLGVNSANVIAVIPPGQPIGQTFQGGPVPLAAQADLTTAYDTLAAEECIPANNRTGLDLGGKVLAPGTYCFATSAQLTGDLVFDAQGDPNAKWTIQVGTTLTTATDATAKVVGGGSGCNVYWKVGTSATLGTRTALTGNVIAATSITLVTGTIIAPGRALARGGAVTLDTNTVSAYGCPVE